jgi:prepilin-type N-terminal cleavage/methylation domain-containing protein/prepilin-type processing-associated H-X9-DG protein
MNRFTLTELLVAIAIIAVLSTFLLPAFEKSKEQSYLIKCASNLKQISTASFTYATEYDGNMILACEDMFGANNTRWCGKRTAPGNPYDARTSELADYLGMEAAQQEGAGLIKECPTFAGNNSTEWNANFEYGTGGYGMNTYAGSRMAWYGYGGFDERLNVSEVKYTSQFLVFSDTAYINNGTLSEYSMIEAPSWAFTAPVEEMPSSPFRPNPVMAGRHADSKCNSAWMDGHVTSEPITFTSDYITHGSGKGADFNIGWIREDNFHIWVPRPKE